MKSIEEQKVSPVGAAQTPEEAKIGTADSNLSVRLEPNRKHGSVAKWSSPAINMSASMLN